MGQVCADINSQTFSGFILSLLFWVIGTLVSFQLFDWITNTLHNK
jgi:hypothetical protein